MKNLIRYILRNEFARSSTYLIPILGVLIYAVLTSAQIFSSFSQSEVSFIESGNAFAFITIFSISIIFVSLKVVTIFKQPMENGLDVLYSSKPITTKGRVFSKFISLWILIIYFSIIFLFATLICGAMDKKATSLEIFNYAISIFIGNVTILFAASSIFVIATLKLNQRSILMLATSIAVFAPSFSIIISQTLKAKMPSENLLPGYVKLNSNLEDVTKNEANIYPTSENTIFINDKNVYVSDFKEGYDDYKSNKIYKYLAYFDPWYQFSSIYDVTYKSKYAKSGKMWSEQTMKFEKSDDLFNIKIGNESYTPIVAKRTLESSRNDKVSALEMLKNGKNNFFYKSLEHYKEKYNSWSFAKQMIFAANIYKEILTNNNIKILLEGKNNNGLISVVDKMSKNEVENYFNSGYIINQDNSYKFDIDIFSLIAWQLMTNVENIYTGFTNPKTIGLSNRFGNTYDILLMKQDDKINIIVPKDYINKIGVYIFWTIATIILVWMSIWFISRKDSY
ncbi:hypothetical protein MYMA111404_03880 [Mycoplasma marinum]|uniref:Uncharacterized protein n=1 Tax=Mycoplasma marinum TaxID=1937190 RepID=A0A4R0XNW7_9MOLU|nr:hypothetical protein [Mycoplasma marinum]TCG10655.1 hypothetical protein C4B24_04290 [Mycoplasma marinum]